MVRQKSRNAEALELAVKTATPGEPTENLLARADLFAFWLEGGNWSGASRTQVERDAMAKALGQIAAIASHLPQAELEAGA